MNFFIYYSATIFMNIVAAIVFHEYINITIMSIIPVFVFALMLFQAFYFRHEKIENGFRTAYGSNLNEDEENRIHTYISNSLFITIPFLVPFALFLPSGVKLISLLIYALGFITGDIVFRIKNKSTIHKRFDAEKEELKRQKENEELGKWK
ncbi:MAG: hypothetical protein IJW92_02170 [Clostridia bacterium]|nr:hypothetical protein [Clostridia bacterium]